MSTLLFAKKAFLRLDQIWLVCGVRKERKEVCLYSAIYCDTLKALRRGSHSFTCKLHHACLSFVRVHQMSPPQQLRQQTSNCSSLLICRPRKDERLSWPSCLTYSGWLTHISGQAWSVHRLDVNSYWLAGIVHNFLSRCATLPHWRGRTPPLHPSPISTPRILHQLFDLAMPIITLLNAFQTSRKFANLTSREMEIF